MLDIRLEIARVNYRNCVEVLLPLLTEHCAAKAQPTELDRFLAGLGADAAPAACALLDEMSVDEKDRLMVFLISAHEERLRNSANRHLSELFGAPVIRIGRFAAADLPGSRLTLLAEQVDIDYGTLVKSPLVGEGIEQIGMENSVLKSAAKFAVQMSTYLSPESLEKQGIRLLNSGKVKGRLMTVLQDAVRQEGVDVTVEDMTVAQSGMILPGTQPSRPDGGLPDSFEETWMRALAAKVETMRKARENA